MPPLRRSHLSVIAVLVLALMLLAACGDDNMDEADDAPPFTPTAASVQAEAATSTPQTDDPPSQPAIEPTSTTQAQELGDMEPTVTPESGIPDEPTPAPENSAPDNPAPELESGGTWYNSEPLSLAELRGKPVLLVFWATY